MTTKKLVTPILMKKTAFRVSPFEIFLIKLIKVLAEKVANAKKKPPLWDDFFSFLFGNG